MHAAENTPATQRTNESGRLVLPELLAPAGDWECAKAAVENGADAIYFGLGQFNARMRAGNFTQSDLPVVMEFLRRRGVKGYVTLNTLVFEEELAEAARYLRAMIAAGVDAVIVQDVGICRMVRALSPDFPIHASTQMTITSAGGVEFARELGCNLVVLARECSLEQIAAIAGRQPANSNPAGLPIEVFVHGALCVAYSGQCLTSEALGGRSANRGECAQACRLPYDLIADGQPVPLGDRRYLLSPQDLAGLELLPDLIRAGVASLKIEGRLKTPEYVANITRIYREAIDRCAQAPSALEQYGPPVTRAAQYEMEMAFSRGLHTGWLKGINNQTLVHGRFGKKRGAFVGEVIRVTDKGVQLRLAGTVKPGDGVVFDAGRPGDREEGGRVYRVGPAGHRKGAPAEAVLEFGRVDLDCSRIHPGDKVWKTSDPALDRRLRQSYQGDTPRYRQPISIEVRGRAGDPLMVLAKDTAGNVAQVASAMPLVPADRQPLTAERIREQIGRLGGTPFRLGMFRDAVNGAVMLPVSELNRLRREFVAELERLRLHPRPWTIHPEPLPVETRVASARDGTPAKAGPAELIVLVRDHAQMQAALECGTRVVYCEFEDPKQYRAAVDAVRRAPGRAGTPPEIWVAPPRIFKSGEEWMLEQVRSCGADGYLARNCDHLQWFAGDRRIGDYSLNIANGLSAGYFKSRFGLERVTASYDLNERQLAALLQASPPHWFEVTIHQHMPMFHMDHCLFCAFLSRGTDYTNCGRPCDRHRLELRDRVGARHPARADAGCRNTVFNAAAQTGAAFVSGLLALGLRHFRLEFLNETPDEVRRTIAKYGQLLRGEISGSQLRRELKLFNQLGVTRGSQETRS